MPHDKFTWKSCTEKKQEYGYLLLSLLKLPIVNPIYYYFIKGEFQAPELQNPAILLLDREWQIQKRKSSFIWCHPWSGGQWTRWWRQWRRWAPHKGKVWHTLSPVEHSYQQGMIVQLGNNITALGQEFLPPLVFCFPSRKKTNDYNIYNAFVMTMQSFIPNL